MTKITQIDTYFKNKRFYRPVRDFKFLKTAFVITDVCSSNKHMQPGKAREKLTEQKETVRDHLLFDSGTRRLIHIYSSQRPRWICFPNKIDLSNHHSKMEPTVDILSNREESLDSPQHESTNSGFAIKTRGITHEATNGGFAPDRRGISRLTTA